MHPMKRKTEEKEIEQQQSKLWNLVKLQEETMEKQEHDRENGQRMYQVRDLGGLEQIENHDQET